MWMQFDDGILADFAKGAVTDAVMLAYLRQRYDHYAELAANPRAAQFRAGAEGQRRDGELEFDPDAVVSTGDDPGAYVMGWSWVSNEEAGIPDDFTRCELCTLPYEAQDIDGGRCTKCGAMICSPRLYWTDPDGGACSRVLDIKTIRYRNGMAIIEEHDGSVLECPRGELSEARANG